MIGRGSKRIPKEVIPATGWRRIVTVVAGTLLLTAIINFASVCYLFGNTSNIGYLLLRAKWNLLRNLTHPVDLPILGDSGGNQGVDPSILKDKLGFSAVNLCSIGDALILNDAWMLGEYISRFGAPRAVLVIHSYDIWSRDKNISVLAQVPGRWWQWTPSANLTLKERVKIMLCRYTPLYAENRTLAELLQHPWTAFPSALKLNPDGFMPESTATPARVVSDAAAHKAFVRENGPVMSDDNRRALEWMAQTARNSNCDLFVANGPLYDSLYADSAFQVYFARLRTAIADIAAGNDHFHYILSTPMLFPKEKMQSADHLAIAAAREYTTRLAEVIDSVLSIKEP